MGNRFVLGCCWACFVFLTATGCGPAPTPSAVAPPTAVTVSQPLEREVKEYEDFTGRTEAMQSVEIRARVTGYLDKVLFKEGSDVKERDNLFEIDRRPFQADLDKSVAQVAVREASLRFKKAEAERNRPLVEKGAVSKSEFEQSLAGEAEAAAGLTAAQAETEGAKLNLAFTQIASPITGRISRAEISAGNLVVADQTLLTSVVSVDPMYVYFDVDEQTLLRIQREVRAGKIKGKEIGEIEVMMGLGSDEGFPHRGTIDFGDNKLDPTTGTIRLRAVIPNPEPKVGKRVLVPGLFARVRLPIGDPHPAVMVAERAIGSDQGQKYVWVVNAKKEVEDRRLVQLGKLENGLRAITKGLTGNEWVIVEGVQRVRPGKSVETREVKMETYSTQIGSSAVETAVETASPPTSAPPTSAPQPTK